MRSKQYRVYDLPDPFGLIVLRLPRPRHHSRDLCPFLATQMTQVNLRRVVKLAERSRRQSPTAHGRHLRQRGGAAGWHRRVRHHRIVVVVGWKVLTRLVAHSCSWSRSLLVELSSSSNDVDEPAHRVSCPVICSRFQIRVRCINDSGITFTQHQQDRRLVTRRVPGRIAIHPWRR